MSTEQALRTGDFEDCGCLAGLEATHTFRRLSRVPVALRDALQSRGSVYGVAEIAVVVDPLLYAHAGAFGAVA